jgi:hypothetical protein
MVNWAQLCQASRCGLLGRMGRAGQLASIALHPKELKRLSAPDAAEPSELREMTQFAEFIASAVEDMWDELPPRMREALASVAYSTVDPPEGFVQRYSAALRGGLLYARVRLKGEQEAFYDYLIAHHLMTNAILGAIERDNPAYQQALSEAVEEAFSDLDRGEELTSEDTLEQLRKLSDEAVRELQ